MSGARVPAEELRAAASVRALAEADGVVWHAAKSNPARGDFWGCCPFHHETTPSFHVVETGGAGGWYRCFGCGAKGTAIDYVMARDSTDAGAAMRRLAAETGLGAGAGDDAEARAERAAERRRRAAAEAARQRAEGERRLAGARAIWKQATPGDSLVAAYLAARGVDLAAIGGVPASLRCARLNCWADGQDRRSEAPALSGPAMVACIGRGRLVGIHRTWITSGGRARLPSGVTAPKKWLGRPGAMYGQPVALSAPRAIMIVGEGIESTLAAWSACLARWPEAEVGAEAALSRGALAEGAWRPPEGCRRVVLLAEGSHKDWRAAGRETRRAMRAIARFAEVQAVLPAAMWHQEADAADPAQAN